MSNPDAVMQTKYGGGSEKNKNENENNNNTVIFPILWNQVPVYLSLTRVAF
jgi:hypothetical protein